MEQLALQIHITTLVILVLVILYTDKLGLAWMRGKMETLPLKKLYVLHTLVSLGLITMVASGLTMFLTYRDFLLITPIFYVKMLFVLALIVNAFFIGTSLKVATKRPFHELTKKERLPLLISGTVSFISWTGAIVCGLLLGL